MVNSKQRKLDYIKRQRQAGKTLKEIGWDLGITDERVRQIIKNYIGDIDIKTIPLREIADEWRVSYHILSNICKKYKVPLARNSPKSIHCDYLYVLKRSYYDYSRKKCANCNKIFYDYRRTVKTCSKKCSRKHYKTRLTYKSNCDINSLTSWRKELAKRLRTHENKSTDEWLVLTDAAKIAEISQQQLIWLTKKNVVTTKNHPTRTWRGRPLRLYSKYEMQLIWNIINFSVGCNCRENL